ncbi:E3 ubiquitin-protein ligase TRIM9-like [Mytilus californianus]|uniref:E3 ubiquitin-protein ligase TRIM9-like n=1 Tax=Mytilus californianus TaxID=6549 RepID=UPI0022477AC9|nr:E3 ubiquitin-protein ligase TRIM9-like [Mytilus californianus]
MAQAASKTCEICVSAPGSCYCLDCEQCFCENCKLLHSRQKISAKHEFKKASDFIPEVQSKCTEHNEFFSFVCIACDVPVCVCCVTEKHNGHKLSKLKDTISELKSKIEQKVLTKLNKTSGNVSKLKQYLSLFNGQVETVIRSITEEGNKIKSMVDQYTANKITSLQEQARKESERLAAILSDHKIAFENAYASKNRKISIEEKSRHDGSLIKMLKTQNEDIDKVEVCPLPKFPSVSYIPKLVKDSDISQLLGTYRLCKTKTVTEIKSERRSSEREIFYQCINCWNQKIEKAHSVYPFDHFFCCQMPMERII